MTVRGTQVHRVLGTPSGKGVPGAGDLYTEQTRGAWRGGGAVKPPPGLRPALQGLGSALSQPSPHSAHTHRISWAGSGFTSMPSPKNTGNSRGLISSAGGFGGTGRGCGESHRHLVTGPLALWAHSLGHTKAIHTFQSQPDAGRPQTDSTDPGLPVVAQACREQAPPLFSLPHRSPLPRCPRKTPLSIVLH